MKQQDVNTLNGIVPSGKGLTPSSTTMIGAFCGNVDLPAATTFGAIPLDVMIALAPESLSCLEISSAINKIHS